MKNHLDLLDHKMCNPCSKKIVMYLLLGLKRDFYYVFLLVQLFQDLYFLNPNLEFLTLSFVWI